MFKSKILHLFILCLLLSSCSNFTTSNKKDEVQLESDTTFEVSTENSSDPNQAIKSERLVDLGDGYFIELAELNQEKGDSIFYFWHKDRINLRSAFTVPNGYEIIHELDKDILYFIKNPASQDKIGISYKSDSVFILGYGLTYETFNDIIQLYEEALNAYGWFELQVLPGDEIDENSGYSKVESDIFSSYDDFIEYLKTLYTDELVESLLSRDLYRNINGYLFSAPSLGRGTNNFISKWYYGLEKATENQLILTVYLEKMSENFYRNHVGHYPYNEPVEVESIEMKSYIIEKVNGLWLFRTFEYPI